MKLLKFFIVFLCSSNLYAQGQSQCPGEQIYTCKIYFAYDEVGNRNKRWQLCACMSGSSRLAQQPNTEKVEEVTSANLPIGISRIYPNPTSGLVNIAFSSPLERATVLLVDVNGKVLDTFTVSGEQTVLNLNAYPSGLYNIVLKTNESTTTQRVIKTE
jgi:Secretion system C-terminal sorting domain